MIFFFLPKQHHRTLESLPDGRFYTNDWASSNIVQVPNRCAPVWCEYTGNRLEYHSWTNPISGRVYETHPLGLPTRDYDSFYDGFYEITAIEGLTFGEGKAWRPDTNQKIRVEKMDVRSIWNPFFQRYDPPCDCFGSEKVKKEMSAFGYIYFDKFTQCPHLFFDVYCNCGMRDNREHQSGSDSD